MLRVQPLELIKTDSEQIVLRCQTFDGNSVQFAFTAVEDSSGSQQTRQIQYQDAFFFIMHDDDGGWSLLKSVGFFDELDRSTTEILGIPVASQQKLKLCYLESASGSNVYSVSISTDQKAVARKYFVTGVDDKKVVTCESQSWTASRDNISWRLDQSEGQNETLLLSLIYFDWARTYNYSESQLEKRSEKINWTEIFSQNEVNEERRKQLQERELST